jgi:hypothetical protein
MRKFRKDDQEDKLKLLIDIEQNIRKEPPSKKAHLNLHFIHPESTRNYIPRHKSCEALDWNPMKTSRYKSDLLLKSSANDSHAKTTETNPLTLPSCSPFHQLQNNLSF